MPISNTARSNPIQHKFIPNTRNGTLMTSPRTMSSSSNARPKQQPNKMLTKVDSIPPTHVRVRPNIGMIVENESLQDPVALHEIIQQLKEDKEGHELQLQNMVAFYEQKVEKLVKMVRLKKEEEVKVQEKPQAQRKWELSGSSYSIQSPRTRVHDAREYDNLMNLYRKTEAENKKLLRQVQELPNFKKIIRDLRVDNLKLKDYNERLLMENEKCKRDVREIRYKGNRKKTVHGLEKSYTTSSLWKDMNHSASIDHLAGSSSITAAQQSFTDQEGKPQTWTVSTIIGSGLSNMNVPQSARGDSEADSLPKNSPKGGTRPAGTETKAVVHPTATYIVPNFTNYDYTASHPQSGTRVSVKGCLSARAMSPRHFAPIMQKSASSLHP